MRPRVFPAEDAGDGPAVAGGRQASMRPRVFPAEDARRLHFSGLSADALQ